MRTLSRPPPVRRTVRFYDYDFDPAKEDVKFRTRAGDFVFDPNTGSLRKVTSGDPKREFRTELGGGTWRLG